MAFFNLLRRQIAPVGLVVTTNLNNIHRRFMSRLRKYFMNCVFLSDSRPMCMCVRANGNAWKELTAAEPKPTEKVTFTI